MIYLSLLIYLALAGLFTLRLFNVLTLSKLTIAFFAVVTLGNILVIELLHFFKALNSPTAFLLVQLVICLVAGVVLIDPTARVFKSRLPRLEFKLPKQHWIEWALSVMILVVLGVALYVGTLSPINNSDSLHTHLPRIYYWIQHGSLQSWDATAATQVFYPINITLQGAWLFLLSGSEMFLFLAMWLGLAAAAAFIFEIAELLGATRAGALLAALVSLSFPVVLLQTYSYQGDVFVATFILGSAFFLLRYHRDSLPVNLALSLLLAIVSVGAKQTSWLYLPVYLLAVLILILKKRISQRTLLSMLGLAVAFFLCFSSLKFIQNLSETHVQETSMIDPGFIGYLRSMASDPPEKFTTNGLRYLYQSLSPQGFNSNLFFKLDNTRIKLFKAVTSRWNIDLESKKYIPALEDTFFVYDSRWPLNEDGAWFGPLSFTLLTAGMVIALIRRDKTRRIYLALVFILLLLFIFGQVILKGDGWGPNRGRHMTIPVMLLAPLVGLLVPRQRLLRVLIALPLSLLSVYLSLSVLFINDARPLVTTNSLFAYQARVVDNIRVTNILNAQYRAASEKAVKALLLTSPDRSNILDNDYYTRLFYQNTGDIPDVEFVNQNLDPHTPLYLLIEDRTLLEFALFGINRTRDLHPVRALADVPNGANVLVSRQILSTPPAETRLVAENERYMILLRQK